MTKYKENVDLLYNEFHKNRMQKRKNIYEIEHVNRNIMLLSLMKEKVHNIHYTDKEKIRLYIYIFLEYYAMVLYTPCLVHLLFFLWLRIFSIYIFAILCMVAFIFTLCQYHHIEHEAYKSEKKEKEKLLKYINNFLYTLRTEKKLLDTYICHSVSQTRRFTV